MTNVKISDKGRAFLSKGRSAMALSKHVAKAHGSESDKSNIVKIGKITVRNVMRSSKIK